jgi:hypothetical protein
VFCRNDSEYAEAPFGSAQHACGTPDAMTMVEHMSENKIFGQFDCTVIEAAAQAPFLGGVNYRSGGMGAFCPHRSERRILQSGFLHWRYEFFL